MTRAISSLSIVVLAVSVAGGCASKLPPPRYFVRADPIPPPPVQPAVVRVPEPMPLPGQLRPIPTLRDRARPEAVEPCRTELEDGERKLTAAEKRRLKKNQENCEKTVAIIAQANKLASQKPEASGYFNAVHTYAYVPGALYHVYSAPLRVTMISLQPGEQVMGKPAMGDATRWNISLGRSLVGKLEQQHLYLRTTQPGIDTSIAIITNRRTYHLEAHALETDYMAGVSWRYPQDEIEELEQTALRAEAQDRMVTSTVDPSSLHFKYEIKVIAGKPRWTPEQVFDDGKKTLIKFPRSILSREAPLFFKLSSSGEALVINYRVRNEYYVVDGLFDVGELRLGQSKQSIVRLIRR